MGSAHLTLVEQLIDTDRAALAFASADEVINWRFCAHTLLHLLTAAYVVALTDVSRPRSIPSAAEGRA